ncbi:MAG: preprotein translocase subunit YajC [Candidatus Eisenbacteria bacterium]
MNRFVHRRAASAVMSAALLVLAALPAGAQGAAPGAVAGPPAPLALIAQFAPFVLVFAIMYFMMIRPQQQKAAELGKLQAALAKGDRVLTQAGIYGTVVGVDEDKVVLRVDENVKLEFQRSTIVGRAGEAKK